MTSKPHHPSESQAKPVSEPPSEPSFEPLAEVPEAGTPSDAPIPEKPLGPVLVQKRKPVTVSPVRQKICETCKRPFTMAVDQKFFICPDCYKKTLPPRKPNRQGDAQVLTQIRCAECGATEYVGFIPQDPELALCKSCFGKRKREIPKP